MCGILVRGDSCVDKPPYVHQDLCVLPFLLRLRIGYHPMEVCKYSILFFLGGWGGNWETRAPPEVIFMFPQSGSAEAPKDQVMIRVLPWVPDIHVPEETTVRLQDVVRPGPHLPHNPNHAPHPFV